MKLATQARQFINPQNDIVATIFITKYEYNYLPLRNPKLHYFYFIYKLDIYTSIPKQISRNPLMLSIKLPSYKVHGYYPRNSLHY